MVMKPVFSKICLLFSSLKLDFFSVSLRWGLVIILVLNCMVFVGRLNVKRDALAQKTYGYPDLCVPMAPFSLVSLAFP